MKAIVVAALLAALAMTGRAYAVDPPSCAVPEHLWSSDNSMRRVARNAASQHQLPITVLGTGSSALIGPDGGNFAYPARLEANLRERLKDIAVKVTVHTKTGQTADAMRKDMKILLIDEKPSLVIWQVGTVDAMRRVTPEDFRASLDEGVGTIQAARADVILMNMQFSPRTESMIAVGPYAENMRVVAQQHAVPLFDRFGIMHYWSDHGVFDFNATARDNGLARQVHECIGRGLASLIIAGGNLRGFEVRGKPPN
jgi:hypothetical protein